MAEDEKTESTESTEKAEESKEEVKEVDWQAEAEKWKALSRKNEDRAKANSTAAQELEQLKAANLSDTEKATAKAVAEAKAEVSKQFQERIARSELKAALAGNKNADAIIDDLNLSKYIGEDGNVISEKLSELSERFAAPRTPVDLGQGRKGDDSGSKNAQISMQTYRSMTLDQRAKAFSDGLLQNVLEGKHD